jgi:hypothetical protein
VDAWCETFPAASRNRFRFHAKEPSVLECRFARKPAVPGG